MKLVLLIAVTMLACRSLARAVESVAANHVVEVTFTAKADHADPFNEVTLDVVFTSPGRKEARVPAFWAGGKTWRVRYASPEVGEHRYKTICSDTGDAGLHGVDGALSVTRYDGSNPLYRHGPIRVAANKRHFEHADGTPFFWLGDTWWMGFTNRLHWPKEFRRLTDDRVEKGFTVVQIVAGLYPDMPAFDPRGANEAGFPWEKDYARINPAYFDHADKRIAHLVESGIAPCIVGAWGYHLPWLGVERMKKHWRYIIARWGAYPVFWCTAGEGAMPYYLASDKAKDAEFQKAGWTEIARFIHEADPFKRPVSIHPTDLARTQVTDASVLDFEMLQTGHGDRASILPTIDVVRRSRAAQPLMPTLNSEVCYEGILGTCHDDVVRIVTWHSLLGGTAGHTYGANGIWQLNRKDQPYGPSPHGGNWGITPWNEAMNLPGSRQAGLARKLLERFEWWTFQPQPQSATMGNPTDDGAIKWGDWIWSGDGDATKDAPVARRSFRKTFDVPAEARISRAIIRLAADDRFAAFINGSPVGAAYGHERWRRYDVTEFIRPGRNVLAVEADNIAANVPANPAALICAGEVELRGGKRISLASSADWRASASHQKNWTHIDPKNLDWPAAKVVAKAGDPPWGGPKSPHDPSIPPAAAGNDNVRIVYVPSQASLTIHKLPVGSWRAERFDPATGVSVDLPMPPRQQDSSVIFEAPPVWQDWVLVLQRGAN